MEQEGGPTFRKILPFTAYQEGWALYTEGLAVELGLYKSDPFGDLGRLQSEMFRAVRLVVDTGIHFKRWPRAQAVSSAWMAWVRQRTRPRRSSVPPMWASRRTATWMC